MLIEVANSRNTIAANNSTDIFQKKKKIVKINRYSQTATFQEHLSMAAYLKSIRYG